MDISVFLAGLDGVFATGSLEKAEGYLRDGLAEAETEGDRSAAITILNEMIGFYRNISAYGEAIQASERAITFLQELGLQETAAFGTTLLNAATAYRAAGNMEQALQLYGRARVLYGKQLAEDDPRLAGLYNNISGLHQDTGDYECALTYLRKAFAILSGHENRRNAAATVQTNMAQMLLLLGREEEAGIQLESSIRLFEEEMAKERTPHYAAALAALAGLRAKQGQLAEACQVYEAALAHLKTCYGENRDYAITCNNYALALDALGRCDDAVLFRTRASDILMRIDAGRH